MRLLLPPLDGEGAAKGGGWGERSRIVSLITPHPALRFARATLPTRGREIAIVIPEHPMRTLTPALAAALARETATLCHCWRLVRRDGTVLGFTDHDCDLTFGGTTFRARSGLEAAEAGSQLGLAVSGGEVAGALIAAEIIEADIAAGRYDDASVETWLVDWSDPDARHLLDIATIGEIRRGDAAFVAELRGIAHRFDEERGRLYRAACDADFGDARCGLSLAAYTLETIVAEPRGRLGLIATAAGYAEGWFTGGLATFLTGANAGLAHEIKAHVQVAGGGEIVLWRPAAFDIAPGDQVRLVAGCDKRFETCRAKFANVVNFRGFPHMPGNDLLLRVAQPGEPGMDGGSLFR